MDSKTITIIFLLILGFLSFLVLRAYITYIFFAIILGNPSTTMELDVLTNKIKNVKNVLRVYQISGNQRSGQDLVTETTPATVTIAANTSAGKK